MKELYEEMLGRLEYLEGIESPNDFDKGRISEIKLAIVRVQQILLENVKNK